MVLMVNGLFKSINKVNILKDISFSINENEILGLIGPNGSGKSTIMKCIAGLYHPTSGEITINGYDITNNYTPGKTSLTVTKVWDDSDDQDGFVLILLMSNYMLMAKNLVML